MTEGQTPQTAQALDQGSLHHKPHTRFRQKTLALSRRFAKVS
jgi:hypothetical protein